MAADDNRWITTCTSPADDLVLADAMSAFPKPSRTFVKRTTIANLLEASWDSEPSLEPLRCVAQEPEDSPRNLLEGGLCSAPKMSRWKRSGNVFFTPNFSVYRGVSP